MKKLVISLLVIALMGFPVGVDAQINFNKLKNKAKSQVKNKMSRKKTSARHNPSSVTSNKKKEKQKPELEKKYTVEELEKLGTYYEDKSRFMSSKFDPRTFANVPWSQDEIDNIKELNMKEFFERLKQDQQKYPEIIKIYKGKNYDRETVPANISYAEKDEYPFNKLYEEYRDSRDFIIFCERINEEYAECIEWLVDSDTQEAELCGTFNRMLARVNGFYKTNENKLKQAMLVVDVCKAAKELKPNFSKLSIVEKRAKAELDNVYQSMGDIFTGNFHKENYKKVVGFTQKPNIGHEDPNSVSNEITPCKPFYMVGYFSDKIEKLEFIKRGSIPKRQAPTLAWRNAKEKGYGWNSQRLYSSDELVKKYNQQSYFVFNLFPKIEDINYKSHLQYLQHLHIIKWFTMQLPGEYEYEFVYNNGDCGTSCAKTFPSKFKFTLTEENLEQLKAYYKKLMQKKINSVTFNGKFGCSDNKHNIVGKDAMKKYGKLIKASVKKTGTVMRPWPNNSQIDYYVGTGCAVFQKDDGRYELIFLNLRKPVGSSKWNFAGIHISNDYKLNSGEFPINAEVVQYGYEITKEAINKCGIW